MNLGNWLPALLAFAAVAFGAVSLILVGEALRAWRRQRAVAKQLEPIRHGREGSSSDGEGPSILRDADDRPQGALEDFLASIPSFQGLALMLEQAGSSWSVTTFLIVTLASGLGLGLVVLVLSTSAVLWLVFTAMGLFLPYMFLSLKRSRRLALFEESFPEAIDLLGRAIRAGHPLSSGVQMVAEEAHPVVAKEFQTVFEEQRFGLPFDDALLGLVDRMDLVDVRIFATAVLVQREVGGNLAEVLDKLAETIRSRFTIRRQLRVYTAQGRLSGYVLVAVPILVALAIFVLDREYMMVLVEEPAGRFMLVFAVVMQVIGYLWIRRIVNIDI